MDAAAITGIPINNIDDLRNITSRLSYFAAHGSREYVNGLVEHLAVHAIAEINREKGYRATRPWGDIHQKITRLLGFQLEAELVLAALLGAVARETQKEKEARSEGVGYRAKVVEDKEKKYEEDKAFGITLEFERELAKNLAEQQQFEEQVIGTWLAEVQDRHRQLSSEDLDNLQDDLARFSLWLASQHSIQTLSLYLGEDEKIRTLLDRLDVDSIGKILPVEGRTEEQRNVRSIELLRFFRDSSYDRKRYIGRQLNQIFPLQMMYLDPAGAKLLSQLITGGTLYLDTNFVYRLIGLQGESLQVASQRLLGLSRELGYVPVVSPMTIDEYKFSLESSLRRAEQFPALPPRIAKLALDVVEEDNIYTHMWQQTVSTGIAVTTDSYRRTYVQIEIILEEYGVEIDSTLHADLIRRDSELANEESLLESTLAGEWYPRHASITRHDAYHRLLILGRRQGHEPSSPLEVPYWFLTCDNKLVKYDRRVRQRLGLKFPFCVLSSQWMQMLSPFRALIDDFEVTQAINLNSPLLRIFDAPSTDTIQDIVHLLKVNEELPPRTTARILANQAFVQSLEHEKDDEKRKELIDEFIFGPLAKMLEDEIDSLQGQLDATQSDKSIYVKQNEELTGRLEQLVKELNELQAKAAEAEQLRGRLAEFDAMLSRVEVLQQQVNEVPNLHAEVTSLRSTEHGWRQQEQRYIQETADMQSHLNIERQNWQDEREDAKRRDQEQSRIMETIQIALAEEKRQRELDKIEKGELWGTVRTYQQQERDRQQREDTRHQRNTFTKTCLAILAISIAVDTVVALILSELLDYDFWILMSGLGLLTLILFAVLLPRYGEKNPYVKDWNVYINFNRLRKPILGALGLFETVIISIIASGIWDWLKELDEVKKLMGR